MNCIKINTVLFLAMVPLLATAGGSLTGRLHVKNRGSMSVSFPLQVDNSGKISNADHSNVTVEGTVSNLGEGLRQVDVVLKSRQPA